MDHLTTTRTATFALLLLAISVTVASAQRSQFAAQRGPYYVGEPVVVQVAIEGVDSNVDVTCQLKDEAPAGLTIQGPQVGRSVRSFTQIINGRMSSHESINYQFGFVVTADKEGTYTVGPFLLTVNGKPREVAGGIFSFGTLENDPDMQIEVTLPQASVYVGQEVPVTIRWSFAGDLDAVRYAYSHLQIRSPMFDQFSFRDVQPRTRTTLTIATANGGIEIDAQVNQEKVGGRDFITVTGTRMMIPDSPGRFPKIPVTCRTQKVTQWGRSLFGDPVPRSRAPALAAGKPISLVVKPVPQRGRPKSFSGAVGRGFSIDVSANRSVVRLGDPISLNITIHGDGNLASISLPPLGGNKGLGDDQFQLPQDQPAGTIDGNAKQFSVNVRVSDRRVTQIPAIAFSWFDPYQEQFATATSKPIALQVMETQVVSAADVISSTGRDGGTISADNGGTGKETAGSPASGIAFVGANLAITRDAARLLGSDRLATAPAVITGICYGMAVVLILGSVVLRQRARRDMESVGKQKRLKQLLQRIEAARRLPSKAASGEIAQTLRILIADIDVSDRAEIDRLLARCDNIFYTTSATADADVAEIASAAERHLREATKR